MPRIHNNIVIKIGDTHKKKKRRRNRQQSHKRTELRRIAAPVENAIPYVQFNRFANGNANDAPKVASQQLTIKDIGDEFDSRFGTKQKDMALLLNGETDNRFKALENNFSDELDTLTRKMNNRVVDYDNKIGTITRSMAAALDAQKPKDTPLKSKLFNSIPLQLQSVTPVKMRPFITEVSDTVSEKVSEVMEDTKPKVESLFAPIRRVASVVPIETEPSVALRHTTIANTVSEKIETKPSTNLSSKVETIQEKKSSKGRPPIEGKRGLIARILEFENNTLSENSLKGKGMDWLEEYYLKLSSK